MFIFLPTISIAEKSYCMAFQEESWSLVVTPRSKWLNLNLFEIWKYRDLLFLFVKREITTVYKQTILGPLWYFIQPILTTIMFTVVFGNIAKISTRWPAARPVLSQWYHRVELLCRVFQDNIRCFY